MKRQRYDLWAEILTVASTPVTKTRILSKCHLTTLMRDNHVKTLQEKGMLKTTVNPHLRFRTTLKGRDWLSRYMSFKMVEVGGNRRNAFVT